VRADRLLGRRAVIGGIAVVILLGAPLFAVTHSPTAVALEPNLSRLSGSRGISPNGRYTISLDYKVVDRLTGLTSPIPGITEPYTPNEIARPSNDGAVAYTDYYNSELRVAKFGDATYQIVPRDDLPGDDSLGFNFQFAADTDVLYFEQVSYLKKSNGSFIYYYEFDAYSLITLAKTHLKSDQWDEDSTPPGMRVSDGLVAVSNDGTRLLIRTCRQLSAPVENPTNYFQDCSPNLTRDARVEDAIWFVDTGEIRVLDPRGDLATNLDAFVAAGTISGDGNVVTVRYFDQTQETIYLYHVDTDSYDALDKPSTTKGSCSVEYELASLSYTGRFLVCNVIYEWYGIYDAQSRTYVKIIDGGGLTHWVSSDGGTVDFERHGDLTSVFRWTRAAPPPPRLGDVNGDGHVRIAVLGDSYISGEGASSTTNPYLPGTDVHGAAGNLCHKTVNAWPFQIAQQLGFDPSSGQLWWNKLGAPPAVTSDQVLFAACSGARTENITGDRQGAGQYNEELQLDQLRWFHPDSVDEIFLSMGGDDAGFSDVIKHCLFSSCDADEAWQRRTLSDIQATGSRVFQALDEIRAVAPNAEVYLMGYPDPLDPPGAPCAGLRVLGWTMSQGDQQWLHSTWIPALNNTIHFAATAAGVHYLDAAELFQGHGICSLTSADTNGLRLGDDILGKVLGNESFHPTEHGQQVLAGFASSELIASRKLGSNPNGPAEPAPGGTIYAQVQGSQLLAVSSTGSLTIQHGPANTAIVVANYSVPTILATGTTDANGSLTVPFMVPSDSAPGEHHLVVYAQATGRVLTQTFYDVPVRPECTDDTSDVDGDGLPNACDHDPTDGPLADVDHDGVANGTDNCVVVANPAQTDSNHDGVGDACDPAQGANALAGFRPLGFQPPDQAPVLRVTPVTLEGNATGGYRGQLSGVTATDGDDPASTLTLTNDAPAVIPLGSRSIKWTVTDPAGKSVSALQRLTVRDTTAPQISCPPNVTRTIGAPVDLGTPTVTDVVDPHPTVSNDHRGEFRTGTTSVTWTAHDASGNRASCIQTVVLNAATRISGTVTDSRGRAVVGAAVWAYTPSERWIASLRTTTNTTGSYQLVGVQPGVEYRVVFVHPSGSNLVSEWFNNRVSRQTADAVVLAANQHIEANAQLEEGGSISGSVTDQSGHPVAGVVVSVFGTEDTWGYTYAATTVADGSYLLRGVRAANDYRVRFAPPTGSSLTGEWFDNASTRASATAVKVVRGQTTRHVGAQLEAEGSISGSVTDASGHSLAGVLVSVFRSSGAFVGSYTASTSADGSYVIPNVREATDYRVKFTPPPGSGLRSEWFDNASTRASVSAVAVVPEQVTAGINAQLGL
jgi:hypothetical protein